MVECDISVPEELRDRFSEMPPIFKHASVKHTDAGRHMQEFVEANGLSQRPRKCLIGSLFGDKILLATPLLRWYMKHGLKVTRIYQSIQWRSSTCFASFTQQVADARRNGDSHPDKKVIGETMKLLG